MTALNEEIEGAIAEGCDLLQLRAPARIEATREGNVKALWVKSQIAGEADTSDVLALWTPTRRKNVYLAR